MHVGLITVVVVGASLSGCTLDGVVGQLDSSTGNNETQVDPSMASTTSSLMDTDASEDPTTTTGDPGTTGGESGGVATTMGPTTGTTTTGTSTTTGIRPEDPTDTHPQCPYDSHLACDDLVDSPAAALGIGCSDSVIAEEFSHDGSLDSIAVLHGGLAGPDSTFLPQEGARSVVLSTGHAGSFLKSREQLNAEELCTNGDTLCPSHDLLRSTDSFLPPVNPTPVGDETCQENPSLIGQGDCSNTIKAQWDLGNSEFVFDYTQLRLVVQVPPLVDALVFDYAFFTAEYPTRYRDGFNDMFLVWAETENWTGNVALDYESRPVTASATRFDYRDSVVPDDCPEPCVAEELHETSMRGHAATNWRSTEIELSPGEEVTLIFGLFDVGDGLTDSAVLLDNIRWNCAIPE